MLHSLKKLSFRSKITVIVSLVVLFSVGIIANSVPNIRDTRPKAATTTVWLNPTNRVTGTKVSPNFLSSGCDMSSGNTCVDEGASVDGDVSFIYTDNTGDIGPISFDFENPNLTGKTIDSVSVQVVARNTVGQNDSAVIAFLTTNNESEKKFKNVPASCPIGGYHANIGSSSEWMSCYTDTSYRTYSWSFDRNFNSTAWTANDLTNIKVGVQAWPNKAGTQTRITMIRVYAQLTDVPAPPPPAPTLSFTASSPSIAYNSATTLNWSSTNATSCTASGSWSGAKGTSGSQSTGTLTSTQTYTLVCSGSGGSAQKSVTVSVGSPPTPPPSTPPPSTPPPSTPPPNGGGTPTPTPPPTGNGSFGSGSGVNNLPKLPPPSNKPVANILNSVKLKLSVPYLAVKLKATAVVGSFSKEIEIVPGNNEITIDTRGANFAFGKELTVMLGDNKFLIKKLKLIPSSAEATLEFGELAMGDLNKDNKINTEDTNLLLRAVNISNQGDINNDGVSNSFDWSILIRYLGRNGD